MHIRYIILLASLSFLPITYIGAMQKPAALSELDKQLFKSVEQRDDAKEVERLLKAGANKEAKQWNDATPLMTAALHGYTNAMRALLDAGANKNAIDITRATPLHAAVNGQQAAAVKMLLYEHADLEALDKWGYTPLLDDLNSYRSNDTVLDLLIYGDANVQVKDRRGNSLLHLAAQYVRPSAIAKFMHKGLSLHAKNDNDETPLHVITLYQDEATATILTLIEAGADTNVPDKEGITPLTRALKESEDKSSSLTKNTLATLRAFFTTVSPKEIQHVIPALITLKSPLRAGLPFPREIGFMIAEQIIPTIVEEKLALAKQYLIEYNEAQLRQEIIASINRVIKNSPVIKNACNILPFGKHK